MTLEAPQRAPLLLGVASLDLTPPPGRLWGRLRGLVIVGEHAGQLRALVAVDCVRVPAGTTAAIAQALGWPASSIALWPGGAPAVDLPVDAVVDAISRACARLLPGSLHVGVGPAYGLRAADPDTPLLAGQRLERSHRQLRTRAPDDRLDALVTRLNQGAPPPGGQWGHLLVDQRIGRVEARDASGQIIGVIGHVAGTDPFSPGGWPSAGLRGALARRLGAPDRDTRHPCVVVGPHAPGVLGTVPRLPSDAGAARRQAEQGADALVKAFERVPLEAVAPDAWWSALVSTTHAHHTVDLGLTRLGPLAVVQVPGGVTDGLNLRLREALGTEALLTVGPSGGDAGLFGTPREAHHATEVCPTGDQQGAWLVDQVAALEAVVGPTPTPPVPPGRPRVADPVPEQPTPHLMGSLRRGRARQGAQRTLDLSVRFRVQADVPVEAPGDRWQLCIEWERGGTWTAAHFDGRPVDDLHQGFRLVRLQERSGPVVQARWTIPEPRRWVGRRFRVRLGPAFGGPAVSAPFKLK